MGFHIGVTDSTNKGCNEDIMKNCDGSSIGSNEYSELDKDTLDDEYDEENEFVPFEMGSDTTGKQHALGACDEQDYFSDIHSESSVDSNICVYDDERDTVNLKKVAHRRMNCKKLDQYITITSDYDASKLYMLNDMKYNVQQGEEPIPRVNGTYKEVSYVKRNAVGRMRVPMHVVFNQAC